MGRETGREKERNTTITKIKKKSVEATMTYIKEKIKPQRNNTNKVKSQEQHQIES